MPAKTCLFQGKEFQDGEEMIVVDPNRTRVGACPAERVTFDLATSKVCANGQMVNDGLPREQNHRFAGTCSCGSRPNGANWVESTPGGSSTPGSCPGKTLIRDVNQNKTCDNGQARNVGAPVLVNPRETGSCPVSPTVDCGSRRHGETFTDRLVGGSVTAGSCVGKNLVRDIDQDKRCNQGTLENIGGPRLVNPREVGNCPVVAPPTPPPPLPPTPPVPPTPPPPPVVTQLPCPTMIKRGVVLDGDPVCTPWVVAHCEAGADGMGYRRVRTCPAQYQACRITDHNGPGTPLNYHDDQSTEEIPNCN